MYKGVKTRMGNIVSRKIWTVWTQVRRCPQPQHGNLLRLPHASKLPCMKPGRLHHCKILHIPSCKEKEMLRRNMKKWLKKLNVSMTFNDHHNEHAQHDPHNIAQPRLSCLNFVIFESFFRSGFVLGSRISAPAVFDAGILRS